MKKKVLKFEPSQVTKSFPDGAPQRESYETDQGLFAGERRYVEEWRKKYQCQGCTDTVCPQCGAGLIKPFKKAKLLKKLDTLGLWEAMEELRIHGITLSISSVAPFDPKVIYCEPFNHDERYQAQVWDEEEQMYQDAFYGKTPEEAFRKAVRNVLEER